MIASGSTAADVAKIKVAINSAATIGIDQRVILGIMYVVLRL
jgi:hypothetical protein